MFWLMTNVLSMVTPAGHAGLNAAAGGIYNIVKSSLFGQNTATYTVDINKTYIINDGKLIECDFLTKYTIQQGVIESDELMKSIL